MLGLKRGTVKLSRHHKEWGRLFRKEKELLLSAFKNERIKIEHVGSTAIAGISAKPIIDMLMAVPSNIQKVFYKKLKELGYLDRGQQGVRGQRLFVKGSENKRTHYLHLTGENSKFWKEHILFRDYLREHKIARDEYNVLKKKLAEKFANRRSLYTKAKAEFIEGIIKKAKKLRV